MLVESEAVAVAKDLLPKLKRESARLTRLDKFLRGEQAPAKLPRSATPERKALAELSKSPWLGLVVTTLAQAMFVDGHRVPDDKENSQQWKTWLANNFAARQIAVHRAALAYGYSFTVVTPGVDTFGQTQSVIRGVSPRRMFAAYEDPAEDEWPIYALRDDLGGRLRLYDDHLVHRLRRSGSDEIVHDGFEVHDAGVCPVIRYAPDLDLEGRATGQVAPFISTAARIDKTIDDRLQAQHFNSWKVRTATGMAEPDTEEEANRAKLKLRQSDLLIAEDPDTKFGTLDETPLAGFIDAAEADVDTLASVSQTPSYNLTGKMTNLAADAITAARAAFTQKVFEITTSLGVSHNQTLRLSALLEGDYAAAGDVQAGVTWQDLEVRSLAQAVDALGKAAKMLGVPPQALWARIPGVTKTDVEEWSELLLSNDPVTRYLNAQFGPDASGDAGLGI
ncbi:phage portal protein [Prescottella equi]|uniref:phage portal protein n=1 Tax=Rhodococcus hoagii TaxID=43767 RepID=UPI0007CD598A|nr:phage portal protein [Prescottella equi]